MKQESTGAALGSQEESPAFRRGENVKEEQIVAAIATQSTTAVVPVASPAGLVPRSRFRRRAEVPA